MKKIGVIYSFGSGKTAKVAEKLMDNLGRDLVVAVDVNNAWEKEFKQFDNFLLGVPTWFDGELPTYWDELIPMLEDLDFKSKKVAIFGNGDQIKYAENFGDAVGIMAETLSGLGATVVGLTSTKGYTFEASRAKKGDKFLGLLLDFENQAKHNNQRIEDWAKQLLSEYK